MLVIPTYNESDNIACLIERIRKAAPREPIFFVDDNSPDDTADRIREVQEYVDGIHLLVRAGKLGYGSACRQAMQRIISDNLDDHIIQFDADLSHPPEQLPRMIEGLRGADVVIGSRYVAGGGSQNWELQRRCLSFGANAYARIFTGVPVHDMTAGFVGYRTQILRGLDLHAIRSEGYAFLMEMKFNLHLLGARFSEFPIVFMERKIGKSKFNRRIMLEGVKFPLKAMAARLGLSDDALLRPARQPKSGVRSSSGD